MHSTAIAYADVLRQASLDLTPGWKELAGGFGKDPSNFRKAIGQLEEAGYFVREGDVLTRTLAGGQISLGLDVAEGRVRLPEGSMALRHDELAPHRLNPRKTFDAEALDELRQAILLDGQVISSLLVRPADPDDAATPKGVRYWIVAGERRWRAVGEAIYDGDWPAERMMPCQMREMTDAEHLRLSISENIQRVDLDHLELGEQFSALLLTGEETFQSLGERLGKTPEYIQQHVRILKLSADDKLALRREEISFHEALRRVAKPRAEPAPQLELDQSPKTSGTATLAPPASAPSPATSSPVAPPFEPSPKMALILVEIAHKVAQDKMARFREGYTAVAEVPAGGAASTLVQARAIGFRSIGGKDEVRNDPRGPGKAWLDASGFDSDDAQGRLWRLWDARIEAGLSADRARAAQESERYVSEWLNLPASQPAVEPGQSPTEASSPLPSPTVAQRAAPSAPEPEWPVTIAPASAAPEPEAAYPPTLPDGAMLGDSLIGMDAGALRLDEVVETLQELVMAAEPVRLLLAHISGAYVIPPEEVKGLEARSAIAELNRALERADQLLT